MKDLSCPRDLALRPDRYDEWTSAMRADQITRLTDARDHDRAAIVAIETVLAGPHRDGHAEIISYC